MNMKLCGQFRAEIVCDRITLFAFPCHPVRKLSLVILNEAGGEVKDLETKHCPRERSEGSGTPHRISAKGFRHQILRFAQNDSVQVREVFIISDVKREPVLQTSAVMDKSRNAPSMERHCVPDYGKPEP